MKAKEQKNNPLILIFLLPILFIVAIFAYIVLSKVAQRNSKVCDFIGNVWLEGIASTENPNPRRGCFTYEELYSGR